MIERIGGYRSAAVLAAAVLGVTACGGVGTTLDDVMAASAGGSTLSGEVRSVDTRRGRLQVRDDYADRIETVRYDTRTRVVSGSREYPVSSLERGDYVRIRLDQDRAGNLWADRIEVRESGRVRDRDYDDDRIRGRTVRLDGRVRQVDSRRNVFSLDDGDDTYIVHVSSRARREDLRRFDRLRRGDRARADVRIVGRGQAELIRFR